MTKNLLCVLGIIYGECSLVGCSPSVRADVDDLPAQVVDMRSAELTRAGFKGSVEYTAIPNSLDVSISASGGLLDVREFRFADGRIRFVLIDPIGRDHRRYVVVERMRSADADRVTVMIVAYDERWRIHLSSATDVIPPQNNAHR